jgi:hypothetical protein
MGQAAKATRQNRTITVDFQDESTYFQLIHDGKAFVEFVLAFTSSLWVFSSPTNRPVTAAVV